MNFKRGQITIFIVIAIVIVGVALVFFMFREGVINKRISQSLEPVYTSFLSCVEDKTKIGIDILESQAGHIELPDFKPGSREIPFSSQLNFLGNPIPYWYYLSESNIQKVQVPSRTEMEKQLAEFLEEKILECSFDNYIHEGFEITLGEPKADASIKKDNVEIKLDMNFGIYKGDDSAQVKTHKLSVDSKLGKLYDSAIKIYEYEQKTFFLENYAVDFLRLYAPVDGVEISCSPKIWQADKVFDEIQEAIEVNTLALGTNTEGKNKYFAVELPITDNVRFINSKEWPSSFEVSPSDESVLIAKPVGNQPGLGILGFCYIPYHFVYKMMYPVMVQIYNEEEVFQFPLAVVVRGNKPREPLDATAVGTNIPDFCEFKNVLVEVSVYDNEFNPANANISYECAGTTCRIGETFSGVVNGGFPQCANGYIVAEAEGFGRARHLYSTTSPGSVDIFLNKLYGKEITLNFDGASYSGDAIITFTSESFSKTIIYPEQKNVELADGQYEVQVYIYKDSQLKLEETVHEQCVEVPQQGISSLFGLTSKKCFDVKVPSQIISNALAGGGKEDYYILESELKSSNYIEINAESLPVPKSLEQLQDNYLLFEDNELEIKFK